MATLGQRLKFARDRLPGMSQSELARRVGVTPQSIQAIESGRAKSTKYAVSLASELDVDPAWLANENGNAPEGWCPNQLEVDPQGVAKNANERRILGDTTRDANRPLYRVEARMLGWSGDLPPKGTVPLLQAACAGVDQEMYVEDGPIDYVPMPPCLVNVPRGYGMLVLGDSMVPVYRSRMVIYINPNLRPEVGDGVVVWKKNKAILVKQLIRRRPAIITLHEFKPEERDFEIPESEIAEIHVIVGTDSSRRL